MPEPREVAAAVAAIIRSHPERWDQGVWVHTPRATTGEVLAEAEAGGTCETTACVAGWAVIVSADPATTWTADQESILGIIAPGEAAVLIRDQACAVLGLSEWEQLWLFDSERTGAEVLGALDDIAAGNRPHISEDDYWEDAVAF